VTLREIILGLQSGSSGRAPVGSKGPEFKPQYHLKKKKKERKKERRILCDLNHKGSLSARCPITSKYFNVSLQQTRVSSIIPIITSRKLTVI
jgi:hypothetical protein